MLDDIHNHWRRAEAVRIKCLGVPTLDMDNICFHLEVSTIFSTHIPNKKYFPIFGFQKSLADVYSSFSVGQIWWEGYLPAH
jgi:hypothetical protein